MSIYTCAPDEVYDVLIKSKPTEDEILIGLERTDPKHVKHIYTDIPLCRTSKKIRIYCAKFVDDYNWPMLAREMRPLSNEEYMMFKYRFPSEKQLLDSVIAD